MTHDVPNEVPNDVLEARLDSLSHGEFYGLREKLRISREAISDEDLARFPEKLREFFLALYSVSKPHIAVQECIVKLVGLQPMPLEGSGFGLEVRTSLVVQSYDTFTEYTAAVSLREWLLKKLRDLYKQ